MRTVAFLPDIRASSLGVTWYYEAFKESGNQLTSSNIQFEVYLLLSSLNLVNSFFKNRTRTSSIAYGKTFHYINIKKPYQKSKSCKSQILSKDHTSSSKDHTSKSIKEVHENANFTTSLESL